MIPLSERICLSLNTLNGIRSTYKVFEKDFERTPHNRHLHGWLNSIIGTTIPDKLCCLFFLIDGDPPLAIENYTIDKTIRHFSDRNNCEKFNRQFENCEDKAPLFSICEEIEFLIQEARLTLDALLHE